MADGQKEFSMEDEEGGDCEAKPFYKSTLFLVIAGLLALVIVGAIISVVVYFTVFKQADETGGTEAPSDDTDGTEGPSTAITGVPSSSTATTPTVTGAAIDVAKGLLDKSSTPAPA